MKTSRPLYEGVDWNNRHCERNWVYISRPLYEGVDWNNKLCPHCVGYRGRPLYEGVDWNYLVKFPQFTPPVALFTRAWIEIHKHKPPSRADWSPSLRGRGLKSPFICFGNNFPSSPSLRGRGLKLSPTHPPYMQVGVALFTRAWIEMTFAESCIFPPFVALFTRAWIEICHKKRIVCKRR